VRLWLCFFQHPVDARPMDTESFCDLGGAPAGVKIPPRVAFHIFRHTYGAWMRRHGKLDTSGLVGTGAWKSRQAAAVYEHVETSEEARKADLLPIRAPDVRSDENKPKA
jgi:integrase